MTLNQMMKNFGLNVKFPNQILNKKGREQARDVINNKPFRIVLWKRKKRPHQIKE